MLNNYQVLLNVSEESQNSKIDSEMEVGRIGVETQMLSCDFLLGITLRHLILQHSNNLKSLQHDTIFTTLASEGQSLAKFMADILKSA